MRRMTEERQIMRLDGIGEGVELESPWIQGGIIRDRLDTGRCRSLVFRVDWVDMDTCLSESQCSE